MLMNDVLFLKQTQKQDCIICLITLRPPPQKEAIILLFVTSLNADQPIFRNPLLQ